MILGFLPYKTPCQPRKKIGWIRYVTFASSLIFVAALFLVHVGNHRNDNVLGIYGRKSAILCGWYRIGVSFQG